MTIKRSKNYLKATKILPAGKVAMSVKDAVTKVQQTSYSKFNASIELHVNLNIDPKKTDQRVNVTTTLPFSTGKVKKILVIAGPEGQEEAKKAGADYAMGKDAIEKIEGGWLDFEAVVATPEIMPDLAKVARILGPKGLMPNPKNNTVTQNVGLAVTNLKKGQVTLKTSEESIIHAVVGHDKQNPEEVQANIEHIINLVKANKPNKVKGIFLKSVYLSPTMGPSVRIST